MNFSLMDACLTGFYNSLYLSMFSGPIESLGSKALESKGLPITAWVKQTFVRKCSVKNPNSHKLATAFWLFIYVYNLDLR